MPHTLFHRWIFCDNIGQGPQIGITGRHFRVRTGRHPFDIKAVVLLHPVQDIIDSLCIFRFFRPKAHIVAHFEHFLNVLPTILGIHRSISTKLMFNPGRCSARVNESPVPLLSLNKLVPLRVSCCVRIDHDIRNAGFFRYIFPFNSRFSRFFVADVSQFLTVLRFNDLHLLIRDGGRSRLSGNLQVNVGFRFPSRSAFVSQSLICNIQSKSSCNTLCSGIIMIFIYKSCFTVTFMSNFIIISKLSKPFDVVQNQHFMIRCRLRRHGFVCGIDQCGVQIKLLGITRQ
ncbi:hypothetical protein [Desulfonatronum sp. SC1]|uniref:hypothetical protein n=1 Tax=Desulfonatronum sp. SC1 TaxID=2109626 RepID=UPI0011B1E210|nr:hypothetical protein [Desulfonatronum sp. SC1]